MTGFRYLARQDQGWNGAFAETEFFLALTRDGFGEVPAARAMFGKLRKAQAADLKTPVRARFLKVRVLSEVNGGAWASAAELAVVGS